MTLLNKKLKFSINCVNNIFNDEKDVILTMFITNMTAQLLLNTAVNSLFLLNFIIIKLCILIKLYIKILLKY